MSLWRPYVEFIGRIQIQILLQTRKNRGNRYGKIDLCILEFRCEIPRENGIWLF